MAATETGTLAQDGVYDAGAATWSETGGITISEGLGLVAGFRFTGFTVGPARVESGTLTVTVAPVSAEVPCTLNLYAQGNSDPSAFADANPALTQAQMSRTSDLLVATSALTSAGQQSVEFTLDAAALNAALNMTKEWQGAINFTLHTHTADGSAMVVGQSESGLSAALSLSVERTLFDGVVVDERTYRNAQSRADICPVTGFEDIRERWVWSEHLRRYVTPGQDDPDTDDRPTPRSVRRRLINER